MRFTRWSLRAAVGVLWLIAGGLQLQSFMFTSDFAHDVLGSAALSQPRPLHAIITLAERLVAADPVPWNWLLALTELGIGAGLVLGRSGRLARAAGTASIVVGVVIWVVGEGLGGLLAGTGALSTGAPGAALLYSALTALAWPRPTSVGEAPLSIAALRRLWTAFWLLGAVLVFVPAQWGAKGLSAQAAMGWMMSPHWTTAPTLALATWLAAVPAAAAVVISLSMFAAHATIGLAPRWPARERPIVLAGVALTIGYWIFAQGFGGLSTGTATDVGTAPPVVVLAVFILGAGGTPSATDAENQASDYAAVR